MSNNSPNSQDVSSSVQAPKGYRIIDRFPITSAFKEVFKAVKTTRIGQTPVVLKRYQTFTSEQLQDVMKRFHSKNSKDMSEILAKDTIAYWAGPLNHPNLVPCDVVENDVGEVFLVEPLLDSTLDKRFPSTYREFLNWAEGLLEGLAYLHQNGYVHGDIKPDNMGLLYGRAVLLDYGISTQFGEVQRNRINPGSIKTRPPELFGEGVKLTTSSDMWSLGASFYFMLTKGDYPFLNKQEVISLPPPKAVTRHHLEEAVRDRISLALDKPRRFRKNLDENMWHSNVSHELFRDLVKKCLVLAPEKRASVKRLLFLLDNQISFGLMDYGYHFSSPDELDCPL